MVSDRFFAVRTKVKMRISAWFMTFAVYLTVGWSVTEASARTLDDQAALLSLDTAFQARVDLTIEEPERARALRFIHKVIDRIATSFIEPFDVRELANFAAITLRRQPSGSHPEDLAHAAVDTVLRRLNDPYATFDARQMKLHSKHLSGIGIEALIVDGELTVIAPLDGSPAQNAGVEPGDIIIEIDREVVRNATLAEAMRRIRGPLGTDVLLGIQRNKIAQKLSLKVPRTRFRVLPLRHTVFGGIVYIRIAFFGPNTEKLLRKSLAAIREEMGGGAPRAYIVDLRNNPGGLVGQAILVADAFLEKGMIVATIGRDSSGARRYDAYRGDFIKGLPIVILQNEASASASEILAAALKDHQRAIIMGTRSYGKGIVQTAYPFGARGRVKFTTHKYVTAAGRQIQGVGVLPDIVVNGDPRPTYGTAAVPIDRCPTAGKARDRMLGCALLFLHQGRNLSAFIEALPKLR